MSLLIVLLIVVLVLIIGGGWWYWRYRKQAREIVATDSATGVDPKVVLIPEADGDAGQTRRRTGETQELKRKVVHGPYRPIEDRSTPTTVQSDRENEHH